METLKIIGFALVCGIGYGALIVTFALLMQGIDKGGKK